MPIDAGALERLVPDEVEKAGATGAETLQLHLDRYAFAGNQIAEDAEWRAGAGARPVKDAGRVLDLACGVGYGTRLVADRCGPRVSVLGVDVSAAAVGYASRRYGGANVAFAVGDAMGFAPDAPFDAVVSLETIEHLPDPVGFVARLASWVRPGGLVVASVPTTPSVDLNPHHLHDFSESRFRAFFEGHGMREQARLAQIQPVSPLAILRRDEMRLRDARRNLLGWYARHPAALARRIGATLRHGFANHYLTIAWRAPGAA